MQDSGPSTETGDYAGASSKKDAAEIALVRKLDIYIMPILWIMYFMNYLDRNAITTARLNGMEKDPGMVGAQYNTCISILYVGYLLMQVPSNMLISSTKVRPSLYMSICMSTWAVVSATTAATQSYTGMVLCRFFIGVVEAPYYPAALCFLSMFYTRKEIATRLAILYSGNIFSTSFAGLIAAAILVHHRWLFTLGCAFAAAWILPDFPLTTRWLKPAERRLAHDRIARDTVGIATSKGPWSGFVQAVKDPRLYLLCFMQNMHISACSFNNFFPTVIGGLGFNSTITLLLTCPPYLVSGLFGILAALSSGKFNERTWHITGCMGLALTGFIISCATLNVAARYVSCFMFASGAYAVNSIIFGWVSATLGQTTEKKAVALSIVNVFANLSYVYTPYLYPKSDGPHYLTGMASDAAFATMTIASTWALRIWLRATNHKLQNEDSGTILYYAY
ncbi:major facilitator superfamily domain-containing protein [Exophiala viscosa]|uniref:Major facilitator superfamily domain-containing protein n=1 Tax=Exophiala viscosa TaxID=2486360 RepID=A0AAN6IKQ4_9EURO|nr:major facilitator superfamily domain-containing protein [Exophiala viscosa]